MKKPLNLTFKNTLLELESSIYFSWPIFLDISGPSTPRSWKKLKTQNTAHLKARIPLRMSFLLLKLCMLTLNNNSNGHCLIHYCFYNFWSKNTMEFLIIFLGLKWFPAQCVCVTLLSKHTYLYGSMSWGTERFDAGVVFTHGTTESTMLLVTRGWKQQQLLRLVSPIENLQLTTTKLVADYFPAKSLPPSWPMTLWPDSSSKSNTM